MIVIWIWIYFIIILYRYFLCVSEITNYLMSFFCLQLCSPCISSSPDHTADTTTARHHLTTAIFFPILPTPPDLWTFNYLHLPPPPLLTYSPGILDLPLSLVSPQSHTHTQILTFSWFSGYLLISPSPDLSQAPPSQSEDSLQPSLLLLIHYLLSLLS